MRKRPVAAAAAALRDRTGAPSSSSSSSPPVSANRSAPSLLRTVFLPTLLLRLLLAFLTRTFFQPDEYFQSLEVAHRIVFGYGYRTWEWRDGRATGQDGGGQQWATLLKGGPIRSPAWPVLFVPGYWALHVLGLDQTPLLVLVPRLVQAVLAAVGDLYTYKLAARLLGGREGALTALVLAHSSLYGLYTATRTFSNNAEAVLTVMALYYWPFEEIEGGHGDDGGRRCWRADSLITSLCLASLACLMRPTNALLWVFLGIKLLWTRWAKQTWRAVVRALTVVVLVGALSAAFTFVLDTLFFSLSSSPSPSPFTHLRLIPTFTPLPFLLQNVLHSVSVFYGANPWHWYLSQGVPVLCWTQLPLVALGAGLALRATGRGLPGGAKEGGGENEEGRVADDKGLRTLAQLCLWTVFCYSLLSHKEFRFLQPLVPVFSILAARAGGHLVERDGKGRGRGRSGMGMGIQLKKSHLVALLLTTLPPAWYLVGKHQRGQVEVLYALRSLRPSGTESASSRSRSGSGWGEVRSVGFLMPCHSTPWQSHLHWPELEVREGEVGWSERTGGSGEGGRLWKIGCEPRLSGDSPSYKDQSDYFYADPYAYIIERFPASVDATFPPSPAVVVGASTGKRATTTADEDEDEDDEDEDEDDLGWRHTWPSHLVVFETLLDVTRRKGRATGMGMGMGAGADADAETETETVGSLLRSRGYEERLRVWNTHFHEDERRRGDVVVLAWRGGGPRGRGEGMDVEY